MSCVLSAALLVGCVGDRLNMREIVVAPAKGSRVGAESIGDLDPTVQAVLVPAGFQSAGEQRGARVWRWEGPKQPGLSVYIREDERGGVVRLDQDLFGPMGPTEKYKRVESALIQALRTAYGPERLIAK